jgi:class 3 adenylate cyclase
VPILFEDELIGVIGIVRAAPGPFAEEHIELVELFAEQAAVAIANDEHELQAIRLALAAQERLAELGVDWRKRGTDLGLGIGVSAGYATLGRIGFEGRYDYGALGSVTNLASRLSTGAKGGQTLISQRVHAAVEDVIEAEPVDELQLKGFARLVTPYKVKRLLTT